MTIVRYSLVTLALLAACEGCSDNNNPPPPPPVGQWTCFGCNGVSVNVDGSFTFPGSGGAVGYIFKAVSGNPAGKTITMDYVVSGSGTVLPSPASGQGPAQVRLFLWRNGDDVKCTDTTEWYRWWAKWGSGGAGPLTSGEYTISTPIVADQWTDCLGHQDTNQFAAAVSDLYGIGYTFGATYFGHGAYSSGQNAFKLNKFTVQ